MVPTLNNPVLLISSLLSLNSGKLVFLATIRNQNINIPDNEKVLIPTIKFSPAMMILNKLSNNPPYTPFFHARM